MSLARRKVILAGTMLMLVTVGIVYYVYRVKHTPAPLEVYQVAPEFSLPNSNGGMITLSGVQGAVRVVNFWASWSPYSKDELPAFARLKQTYKDDVTIIALDRDVNPSDGRAFIQTLGLPNDVLFVFDQSDAYFKMVQGFAVPETLFLDREGNIRAHIHGPMTYEEMDANIKNILK
jgi:thiol-disulfide isomerase/thioredoxin